MLKKVKLTTIVSIFSLILLYFTTFYNYLLFHSLVEIYSIIIAATIFILSINSKKFHNNFLLEYLGIIYLFTGFLDLLHTLSYKGMNIFIDYDYYANQLWIAARYLESISFLMLTILYLKKIKIRSTIIFVIYALITTIIIYMIFFSDIFPICFIEGKGLTPFKVISEYIISFTLLLSLFIIIKNKELFDIDVRRFLILSIIFTIISELAFTFYIDNYGLSNMIGHYFKIFSFYLIYKAIIEVGIKNPYALVFKELTQKNEELKKALENITTLEGLLPVCAWCNKIRDDKGYWEEIDAYLSHHTKASLTHSICPDCFAKVKNGK